MHSADSKSKKRIPTTDMGVERALMLGLDRSHPILQKASAYLIQVLKGQLEILDGDEKNPCWTLGKRLREFGKPVTVLQD